jgi:hypothetical protein
MSLVSEHRRKITPLLAFTFEQILERSPAPFLIAKCAECTIRKELGSNRNLMKNDLKKICFVFCSCLSRM